MTKPKPPRDTLKAIKKAHYCTQYLVYCRRSMDESESQKNSLQYQRDEIAAFARREGTPVADVTLENFCTDGVVSESHSGFKESDDLIIGEDGTVRMKIDRPKFQQLLLFAHRGYFKGIICLCWDRLSRNKSDDAIVRKLMRKGVDVHFVYATYDKSSAGELHMDIDGMFAEHHSRVTSEKIRATQAKARRSGKWINRAPMGYLNTGCMDHKPQDPARAPIIAELFRLYATGTWSLADLARHANAAGLTSPPMRRKRTRAEMLSDEEIDIEKVERPTTVSRIQSILRNPFYVGLVTDDTGKLVPSTCHDALIDHDTFSQVQTSLSKRNTSIHYTEKIDLPLRGTLRCGGCNRVYTPYKKKGHLYFYTRCSPGCTNTTKNYVFSAVSDLVRNALYDLYLTDEEAEKLNARTGTEIAILEERRNRETAHTEACKKRIRSELAYLRSHQIALLRAGAFTPEDLVAERQRLEAELDQLHEGESISEAAMRGLVDDVLLLSELLKCTLPLYELANEREKERIIRLVFSELTICEKTLKYNLQNGFLALNRQKLLDCAPSTWLSELSVNKSELSTALTALQALLDAGRSQKTKACSKHTSRHIKPAQKSGEDH